MGMLHDQFWLYGWALSAFLCFWAEVEMIDGLLCMNGWMDGMDTRAIEHEHTRWGFLIVALTFGMAISILLINNNKFNF